MCGAADVECAFGLIPDQHELGVIQQVLKVAPGPFVDRTNIVFIAAAALDLRQFRFIRNDSEEARVGSRVAQFRDFIAMSVGESHPPSRDRVLIDVCEVANQLGGYGSHDASCCRIRHTLRRN
jgi:hypothetical protein